MSYHPEPPPPSETSNDDDVPTGASELGAIIAAAEEQGFASEFEVPDEDDDVAAPDAVRCLSCDESAPAAEFVRAWSSRLEGASNPADMVHVSALTCPRCGAGGVFITPFGSTASIRQTAVLHALPPAGGDAPTEGT